MNVTLILEFTEPDHRCSGNLSSVDSNEKLGAYRKVP